MAIDRLPIRADSGSDLVAMLRREGIGAAFVSGEEDLADLNPDHIAPFVCYLATDFAENINGQIFLVYGDTISLVSQPRPQKSIYEPEGTWDLEKLAPMARDVLTKDIYNPAPARE